MHAATKSTAPCDTTRTRVAPYVMRLAAFANYYYLPNTTILSFGSCVI